MLVVTQWWETHVQWGTCNADECQCSPEPPMSDAAVRRKLKHHGAVVGQDRRRDTAATQQG